MTDFKNLTISRGSKDGRKSIDFKFGKKNRFPSRKNPFPVIGITITYLSKWILFLKMKSFLFVSSDESNWPKEGE